MLSTLSSVVAWILILDGARFASSMPTVSALGGLSFCNIIVENSQVLECRVRKGQTLDYRHVRQWSEKEKQRMYSIRVFCDGGNVYLPWPFRARNIVSLEVYGCSVTGFLSEMTIVPTLPDQLTTLILSDTTVEIPFADMVFLNNNIDKVPWATDCGQMSVEKLVFRNIHYDVKISPEERDRHNPSVLQYGLGGTPKHVQTKPCIYHNLKQVDESGSRRMGHYHLRLLPEYSQFPKLQFYNMSNNDMGHVPAGLRHLHSKKFPALRHLDFSNNALSAFEFDLTHDLKSCPIKLIDLRHNFITSIPVTTTRQLNNIGTLFVDLRQNPLRCNCRLAAFREFLRGQYHKTTDIKQRKLVSDITCNNGPLVHGNVSETSLLDVAFDKKCKRWLYSLVWGGFTLFFALTLYLIETPFHAFANRVDPDQAAPIGGQTLYYRLQRNKS